jgi:hypothetical protein
LAQERAGAAAPAALGAATPVAASPPRIQLAILLDTSGSMDGLIGQAKSQIWAIVNQMTRARMAGQRPELRVALYEYGKSSIPASEGYLRQILPLTDDLDEVSAQLFALTTNGGEEYCGRVIGAATEGLSWSGAPADLRVIVIAGNEPFTQGDVDWKTTVGAAVKKGIIVNTIFCGNEAEGVSTGWREGALRGEGTYGFIDQNAASVHIEAPQDKELAELSEKINTTYLGYGRAGRAMAARQAQQDLNAATASPAAPAARARTKASYAYKNSAWDLVDGLKDGSVKLEDLKDEDLPESMRGKTLEEKKRAVEEAGKERDGIRARIGELSAAREKYVAEQMKAKAGASTLEAALTKALREQAEKKGYQFEKP